MISFYSQPRRDEDGQTAHTLVTVKVRENGVTTFLKLESLFSSTVEYDVLRVTVMVPDV